MKNYIWISVYWLHANQTILTLSPISVCKMSSKWSWKCLWNDYKVKIKKICFSHQSTSVSTFALFFGSFTANIQTLDCTLIQNKEENQHETDGWASGLHRFVCLNFMYEHRQVCFIGPMKTSRLSWNCLTHRQTSTSLIPGSICSD